MGCNSVKELREAGLYGYGLLEVRTAELRIRYNECLTTAGIKPTELKEFGIDGMGWSPEVAEEKKDPFYLSQGDANQLAVILSPDQADKPLYNPLHSFDRPIMTRYFEAFMPQIGDITRDTGIWLDVDQGITAYSGPRDLLLVDAVTVRTETVGSMLGAAREQQELVRQFARQSDAWFDPALRRAIIASAKAHGDLRNRRLEVPEMTFADTRNFHTRALGGVFVFREVKKHDALLVCLNGALDEKKERDGAVIVSLGNPALEEMLRDAGLVTLDFDWYADKMEMLERLHECLLAETVCSQEAGVEFQTLTSGQKKGLIQQFRPQLPEIFFELERLMKQLHRPGFMTDREISPELRKRLLHPTPTLAPSLQELVWKLLVKLGASDVMHLFRHDKNLFYDLYNTWPQSRKLWAIGHVRRWKQPQL